ncbi:MAG: PDZ domain-containing protein [Saprospiraceae bacterium]|nr:PDZ domain-containing protein [Saprospiraceae bacterium]
MKTIGTLLAATFLLLPWCLSPVMGQQPAENNDKKIVITKRTVDPDGTVSTETIVKKGKAAENFDADAYLKDNEADNVEIRIREESEGGDYVRITTSDEQPGEETLIRIDWDEFNDAMNEVGATMRELGQGAQVWVGKSCEPSGFLGVQEDSDEDSDAEGLVVEVMRGYAADQAGLKTNDLILSLNDTRINRWSDLTKFISTTKPGDEVRIVYRRGDKEATTTATLTQRGAKNVGTTEEQQSRGFLGVSPDDDDDNNTSGVAVEIVDESAAEAAGLKDGDVITALNDTPVRDWEDIEDIMQDTKPGDLLRVAYLRGNTAGTANATLKEAKNTWSMGENRSRNFNFNNNNWSNDFDVDVRQKPACLGVYSGSWSADGKEGSKVSEFTEESAARDASMQVGDVITGVNGQPVRNHDELWNEIAKYQPGDKVTVEYLRDNAPKTVEASLKACKDQNRVTVITNDDDGANVQRQFYAWNWGENEQQRMRTRRVITIRRAANEGDAAQPAAPAAPVAQDRSLKLESFRAYPNPTAGPVTIEFRSEPLPTIITLFDLSGRQLFREELNAFNGDYNQQFDLNEYAKGTVVIQVQQGDKIFTEQIIVN